KTSRNCASNPGDTSAGPVPTTAASASSSGSSSAIATPQAATQTDRLIPAEQQTNVRTRARSSAATESTASRNSQGGFGPPSDSENRQRTRPLRVLATGVGQLLGASYLPLRQPPSTAKSGSSVSPSANQGPR